MLKFLILSVLCAAVANSQDYCAICSDHTMCQYQGISSACGTPVKVGLEDSEIQALVDAHNEVRNKVALGQETQGSPGPEPSASNMRKMSWDTELASIAQRWAEQCAFGHDTCRNSDRFYVGQNVYMMYSSDTISNYDYGSNVKDGWYGEVKSFNSASISPFQFTEDTGHYTQVVWAESYLVGCGFIVYPGDWYQYYLVCNYGPGGNMLDGTMYEQGNPASNCPEGTSPDATYTGLCS